MTTSLYDNILIETDPLAIAQLAFDYLKDNIPGFDDAAGNLETFLIEGCAQMVAEAQEIGADIPKAIFRYFGATIIGVQPNNGAYATVTSTWTMVDDAGYTIEAGAIVTMKAETNEDVAFEVREDVVVPALSTATGTGEVILDAVLIGEDANGLTNPAQLQTAYNFVDSINIEGSTGYGVDPEDDDAYIDRLVRHMRLLSARPILPADFEIFAREFVGVGRALAIDGYNPADDTYNNERMITMALIDTNGAEVLTAVKDEVIADLEGRREITFVVNYVAPTYTPIDVDFTATSYSIYDATEVHDAIITALTSWLDPSNWGRPPSDDTGKWELVDSVNIFDALRVISGVTGVATVTALTLNGGTVDVPLTGAAPLTTAGTITGTVTTV